MFNSEQMRLVKKKHTNHRHNAKKKGVKSLPFDIYLEKLYEAGILPEQIGQTIDAYQLARFGDYGDYTKESCRFITMKENLQEMLTNGGCAQAGAKLSIKLSGRSKEDYPNLSRENSKSLRKKYEFISPDEETFTGYGITTFCREMGLCQSEMSAVHNSKQKHHRGGTKGENNVQ